jgi:hypothetical protein
MAFVSALYFSTRIFVLRVSLSVLSGLARGAIATPLTSHDGSIWCAHCIRPSQSEGHCLQVQLFGCQTGNPSFKSGNHTVTPCSIPQVSMSLAVHYRLRDRGSVNRSTLAVATLPTPMLLAPKIAQDEVVQTCCLCKRWPRHLSLRRFSPTQVSTSLTPR